MLIIIIIILLIVLTCGKFAEPFLGRRINSTRIIAIHYANWCPACKAMMPIWAEVKAQLGEKYRFVEIDEDIAKTPEIEYLPTIIMIDERGHRYKYKGVADPQALYKWIDAPSLAWW